MNKIAGKKTATDTAISHLLKVPTCRLALGSKPRAKKCVLNITMKKRSSEPGKRVCGV